MRLLLAETSINSKGLPMYGYTVLSLATKCLHVLGFILSHKKHRRVSHPADHYRVRDPCLLLYGVVLAIPPRAIVFVSKINNTREII